MENLYFFVCLKVSQSVMHTTNLSVSQFLNFLLNDRIMCIIFISIVFLLDQDKYTMQCVLDGPFEPQLCGLLTSGPV